MVSVSEAQDIDTIVSQKMLQPTGLADRSIVEVAGGKDAVSGGDVLSFAKLTCVLSGMTLQSIKVTVNTKGGKNHENC